jgi:hypothetical protein
VEIVDHGKWEGESSANQFDREASFLAISAGMRVKRATLAGVLKPSRFDRKWARGYTARFLFRGLTQ